MVKVFISVNAKKSEFKIIFKKESAADKLIYITQAMQEFKGGYRWQRNYDSGADPTRYEYTLKLLSGDFTSEVQRLENMLPSFFRKYKIENIAMESLPLQRSIAEGGSSTQLTGSLPQDFQGITIDRQSAIYRKVVSSIKEINDAIYAIISCFGDNITLDNFEQKLSELLENVHKISPNQTYPILNDIASLWRKFRTTFSENWDFHCSYDILQQKLTDLGMQKFLQQRRETLMLRVSFGPELCCALDKLSAEIDSPCQQEEADGISKAMVPTPPNTIQKLSQTTTLSTPSAPSQSAGMDTGFFGRQPQLADTLAAARKIPFYTPECEKKMSYEGAAHTMIEPQQQPLELTSSAPLPPLPPELMNSSEKTNEFIETGIGFLSVLCWNIKKMISAALVKKEVELQPTLVMSPNLYGVRVSFFMPKPRYLRAHYGILCQQHAVINEMSKEIFQLSNLIMVAKGGKNVNLAIYGLIIGLLDKLERFPFQKQSFPLQEPMDSKVKNMVVQMQSKLKELRAPFDRAFCNPALLLQRV